MIYYLGVDIGGTNIAAGVVDENYHMIVKESTPTGVGRSPDAIIGDMADIVKRVIKNANLRLEQFQSVGIGMPSYINPKTHLLVHSNNFGWANFPIYSYLEKYLELPIIVENDANCAVLGEALCGTAQKYKNVLMLTLGTGVGSGILLDGKIYSGADGMGAELGHTKLLYQGELCSCGQRGCMEAYCSATALIRQARMAMRENPSTLLYELCNRDSSLIDGKAIFAARAKKDETAIKVVEQYIDYLAEGISSFVAIFRPEVILLGGGIAEAGDVLIEPLQRRLQENTYLAAQIGVPPIKKAALGNDAGIIGAAFLEKYKYDLEDKNG